MVVEGGEIPPPSVVLSPRGEWPPAIRPAIWGKRRIIPDSDDEGEVAAAPPAEGKEMSLEEKFASFQKNM